MSEPVWKSLRWRCCLGPEDAFDSDWGRTLPFWDISWDSLPEATRQQWTAWNPKAWAGTHGTPVTGGPARWELLEFTDQEGKSWAIEVWNRPNLHLRHPDGQYQELFDLVASALESTPGGAWEWDATTDGPELPCIFLPLERVTCPYPQDEINELLAQPELAPLAVAALEQAHLLASEDTFILPDDYCLAIHLSTLLGIWRDPRAFRSLVRVLEDDNTTANALFGDFTSELLPRVLAATADGRTDMLVGLVELTDAYIFHRWAALDALSILHKEGSFEGFPELLARWMETTEPTGDETSLDWSELLASKAVDLRLVQYRGQIQRILTTEDSSRRIRFADWKWAEEELTKPPDPTEIPSSDCRAIPGRLAQWYCFSDEAQQEQRQSEEREAAFAALEDLEGQVTAPIERSTPKIGRNDPCPCGSGKKFKKCCGGM